MRLLIRKIFILIAIGLLISVLTASLVSSAVSPQVKSQSVPSKGTLTVINLGVYSNSACTANLTALDFGTISPGATSNITLWLKNIGNSNETLSLTTNTWSPATVSQWLSLSWNQAGTVLAKNQVVAANLTLTVSPSVDPSLSDFTFNVVIAGTSNSLTANPVSTPLYLVLAAVIAAAAAIFSIFIAIAVKRRRQRITSSAGVNGAINPSGSVSVKYNDTESFIITPDSGYHIADVVVDVFLRVLFHPYSFINIKAAHTITAGFAINT
jgi:hypothetical protein